VVQESKLYREMVTHGTKGIIGEPTSLEVVHAHKGSVEIKAKARGVAAHSSSRAGINANLAMIPFLTEMKAIYDELESDPKWQNDLFDPPSMSLNIRVRDDSPALNVTAAKSSCSMYLRTLPGVDESQILNRIEKKAKECELTLEMNRWGDSFFAEPDSEFVQESLKLAHRPKPKTVSYGTDGGVFSELSDKIVFGPGSIAQAHTRNEWIALEQLTKGPDLYAKMIRHWCCR
jgi:acetylornithine deacetylase